MQLFGGFFSHLFVIAPAKPSGSRKKKLDGSRQAGKGDNDAAVRLTILPFVQLFFTYTNNLTS